MVDYNITAVVCSKAAKTEILSNLNKIAFTGSDPKSPIVGDMIPGYNIPIIASSAVTTVDSDSIYFRVIRSSRMCMGPRTGSGGICGEITSLVLICLRLAHSEPQNPISNRPLQALTRAL